MGIDHSDTVGWPARATPAKAEKKQPSQFTKGAVIANALRRIKSERQAHADIIRWGLEQR